MSAWKYLVEVLLGGPLPDGEQAGEWLDGNSVSEQGQKPIRLVARTVWPGTSKVMHASTTVFLQSSERTTVRQWAML